uniref:Uncharacterized protein n=1 Tax=Arundo donax TaxID=35708 RepID=A0A0A9A1J1_ARUDO
MIRMGMIIVGEGILEMVIMRIKVWKIEIRRNIWKQTPAILAKMSVRKVVEGSMGQVKMVATLELDQSRCGHSCSKIMRLRV